MFEPEAARALAKEHLADLDERWQHVQSVAAVTGKVAASLSLDVDLVVVAAWLHDIGYASEVAETGFHALDGARYLRRLGIDDRVVCLVAHHSCASVEADERGLGAALTAEFPREESETADALWYADMTTGPTGERMSVDARIEEIRMRYGPGHVVSDAIARAEQEIVAAVRRTEALLRAARALL